MLESALSIFIIVESFAVAESFDGGERFCRFIKYMFSLCSGIAVVLYQHLGGQFKVRGYAMSDITILVLLVTLALFFWPRVLSRFGFYKRRIGDR